jgi:MFS family permease
VLILALLGSGIITLQQSALPLDMARGGLARPGLAEAGGGLLIGLQLGLLLLLQWPVGHWLAAKPVAVGLRLSLLGFAAGCGLLGLSALLSNGLILLLAAQPLLAIASAAFLPTITEAVVETVAPEHQGLALGIYSQTWALSGIALPPLAGWLLEHQRHGLGLWLLMGGLCLPALALTQQKPAARARNY